MYIVREGTAELYMQDQSDKAHLIMEIKQSMKDDVAKDNSSRGLSISLSLYSISPSLSHPRSPASSPTSLSFACSRSHALFSLSLTIWDNLFLQENQMLLVGRRHSHTVAISPNPASRLGAASAVINELGLLAKEPCRERVIATGIVNLFLLRRTDFDEVRLLSTLCSLSSSSCT